MGGAGEEVSRRGRPDLASVSSSVLRRPKLRQGVCRRTNRGLTLPALVGLILAVVPGVVGDGRVGFVGTRLPLLRGAGLPTIRHGGITRSAALGGCLVEMSDGSNGRLLNSRRLGAWAEGLGTGEKRMLGSRRVAQGLHFILSKGVKKDKSQQPISTAKVQPEGTEDVPTDEVVCAPAAPSATVLAAEGVGGPQEEEEKFRREWGTINPVGASPPRPAELASLTLTPEEEATLLAGERVQRQERDGRVGTGSVVVDVKADISTVFAVLTDLERYVERIHTVRRCTITERGAMVAKAQFALSRFNLVINTVLRCDREANMLRFELDKERRAPMVNESEGFWFLEEAPGRGGEYTRIWMSAGIKCSSLLPTFLVDYAAARALPRATAWLKPTIEAIYKELPEGCGDVKGVVCGHQCEGCVESVRGVEEGAEQGSGQAV
mmetsp:Transcript_39317/g.94811  ORF Transcript_39317/g.94811 Transcript_39317/m.94811 type:complete len:436 (-) Transcript_39317:151-1458(-)